MRFVRIMFVVCIGGILGIGLSIRAQQVPPEELRSGKSFMPTKVYSEEEDLAPLKLYKGLRVADVSDGMDKSGLHGIGLVDPKIRPLWKDTKHFTHRIVGIAVTARYVPTQQPPAGKLEPEQFDEWEGHFYSRYSSEPFMEIIRKGTALVMDDAQDADVGSIGSYNIMEWASRGCVGVVTDASARDTDEIIAVGVPLYLRKPGRRELYKKLGLPLDDSVKHDKKRESS